MLDNNFFDVMIEVFRERKERKKEKEKEREKDSKPTIPTSKNVSGRFNSKTYLPAVYIEYHNREDREACK